jgi:hypothetical protein
MSQEEKHLGLGLEWRRHLARQDQPVEQAEIADGA